MKWFNAYKLCLWMRMNKPFRDNKLIAPPEKNTDRKVHYRQITDNVMNNNLHPGLTDVIGSAQEVNQKCGITHLWHYGLMKDDQDLLVHVAR